MKTKIDEGIQPADAHRLLAERAEAGADVAEQAAYGDRRPLVLVAERDPYAADLIEHFLREEGYDVELASDAMDAERKFAGLSPQLAIVELLLSGGEGADLCRRLKARRPVPVLAVSPLDARDAASAAGADAYLQKPLDPPVLVSTVNDLLESSPLAEAEAEALR